MQSPALIEGKRRGVEFPKAANGRRIPGAKSDEGDAARPDEPARKIYGCIPRKALDELARRDAAESADRCSVDKDLVGEQNATQVGDTKRERLRGIAAYRHAEANPDEAIGIVRWPGPLAIIRNGPGAVIEVEIGPAEVAAGVVAEVVADGRRRFGLLRATE
jgi:hypothetical protein